MTKVEMTVNGKQVSRDVEGQTLLVSMLREDLRLTGTHVGCDTSQCGACVVHVNGKSVKACTMFAIEADGADIKTIEGMAGSDGASRIAVRILHTGHGDDGGQPSQGQSETDRGRSAPPSARQYLPLHGIPQHRQGDHGRIRSG